MNTKSIRLNGIGNGQAYNYDDRKLPILCCANRYSYFALMYILEARTLFLCACSLERNVEMVHFLTK